MPHTNWGHLNHAPLVDVTLSDDDFSDGETATAEIPLKGDTPPTFFKATIE